MNTITPLKPRSNEHGNQLVERTPVHSSQNDQLSLQTELLDQKKKREQAQLPEQQLASKEIQTPALHESPESETLPVSDGPKAEPMQKLSPEQEVVPAQQRTPAESVLKQALADDQVKKEDPGLKKSSAPPWQLIVAIAIVICLIAAVKCYPNLNEFLNTEATEDAYVNGHVHQVGSKIAGTIESVLVKDNQFVQKDQVLATIDPRDVEVELAKTQAHLAKVQRDAIAAKQVVVYAARIYSAANETANGSIAQSENAITKAEAGIQAAQSDVALAKQLLIEREAELHKANLDLGRYTALASEGAVTLESLDVARKDHDVALAARDAAIEAVGQANSRLNQAYADLKISKSQLVNAKAVSLQADAADAQISVNADQQASSEAAIKEAEADVRNARLRMSYTKILAPVAGTVGKKTVEEGQRIQPGTALLAVVSSDKWIVANFKETQLKNMRIGQKVKIAVDAFGDREFYGHVESFSPASGASFALLPPDNATGNFTKVVQRVPVKILFDHGSLGEFDQLIAPGMSCDVKVWVR